MCNITIFFPTDQTATKISVPLAGGPDGIRGREADTDKQNKNNMKVTIKTNFRFTVQGIEYTADREIRLVLASSESGTDALHTYEVELGSGESEAGLPQMLSDYAEAFAEGSPIKEKTKQSYRLMVKHLRRYGDRRLDEVTTEYLQGFIAHLEGLGHRRNTVRLAFQKLACVLHNAYREGLFDDRILQRVRRPRRDPAKKTFLTERELGRLARTPLPERYGNIRRMFLFSCYSGLRFSDVVGLETAEVKRRNKHLWLEFHQQKTDTQERIPLCTQAEEILNSVPRRGRHVFESETHQRTNKVLKEWSDAAHIRKHVTFHTARHTFCVMLLAHNVPLYTVQRLMCHSDIGTTGIYADLTDKSKSSAVGRIPKLDTREKWRKAEP